MHLSGIVITFTALLPRSLSLIGSLNNMDIMDNKDIEDNKDTEDNKDHKENNDDERGILPPAVTHSIDKILLEFAKIQL